MRITVSAVLSACFSSGASTRPTRSLACGPWRRMLRSGEPREVSGRVCGRDCGRVKAVAARERLGARDSQAHFMGKPPPLIWDNITSLGPALPAHIRHGKFVLARFQAGTWAFSARPDCSILSGCVRKDSEAMWDSDQLPEFAAVLSAATAAWEMFPPCPKAIRGCNVPRNPAPAWPWPISGIPVSGTRAFPGWKGRRIIPARASRTGSPRVAPHAGVRYVARPGIMGQLLQRMAGRRSPALPYSCTYLSRKWRTSRGISSFALPQGRQLHQNHVEAVVEVLAHAALGRRRFQMGVGRRHHAYVRLYRSGGTQGPEFLFLQKAE